jgi:hypothetical protein
MGMLGCRACGRMPHRRAAGRLWFGRCWSRRTWPSWGPLGLWHRWSRRGLATRPVFSVLPRRSALHPGLRLSRRQGCWATDVFSREAPSSDELTNRLIALDFLVPGALRFIAWGHLRLP